MFSRKGSNCCKEKESFENFHISSQLTKTVCLDKFRKKSKYKDQIFVNCVLEELISGAHLF